MRQNGIKAVLQSVTEDLTKCR